MTVVLCVAAFVGGLFVPANVKTAIVNFAKTVKTFVVNLVSRILPKKK